MAELSNSRFAIIIESIGTATPAQVGSVAKGLGLAVEETVRAVYRAPFILASKLEAAAAHQVGQLLSSLGFVTHVVPDAEATPRPAKLYDVAVQLSDPATAINVVGEIACFCGTGRKEALQLLFSPPGLVLGGVSEATANALAVRLERLGAELVRSRPSDAHFDLFASGLSATMSDRLCSELKIPRTSTGEAIFAADLAYAEANRLWRLFGRSGGLLLVDRQFQHFDIIMEMVDPAGDPDVQARSLFELFAIPQAAFPKLIGAGDIIVASGRRYGAFESEITALAAVGIAARADLATFAQQAIAIDGIPPADRDRILEDFGLDATPNAQSIVTPRLPVMMARAIRHAVTAAGGQAWPVEA